VQKAIGDLHAQEGREREAVVHYRQALELDPNDGSTHFILAKLLRQLRRDPEARQHFSEAERLFEQAGDTANLNEVRRILSNYAAVPN
jgi:Flp pilus assembly protein TadD